ncbi:aminotransferase class IV [Frankia sp. AgPm24]|nr:aminotransferase class IV [Frankia sp. AgPm24]
MFGALMHRRRAQRAGFDDALFASHEGLICEISTSNIGFVRGGRILWPQSEWLPGVTMALINQALDEPAAMEPIQPTDMPDVEAGFATNAGTGVRAVLSVDHTRWPTDHEVLTKVRELYAECSYELL